MLKSAHWGRLKKGETERAKLGTKERPIIVPVQTDDTAEYVADACSKNEWHYIVGFEPNKPKDISDLEKMLNPSKPIMMNKIGRNEPCLCGSGKKFKKYCGSGEVLMESRQES